jgi:2-oxoisovalerate dehydrogenase E1 component
MNNKNKAISTSNQKFSFSKEEILHDYRIGWRSRIMSLVGRKEVLTGKASFGIFGDGIELPQLALAKVFNNGDFRAGYYRDQTIELALENVTVAQFFSQLYADPSLQNEPNSSGRQMNSHFATRLLDENGNFKNLLNLKNTAADLSPTAGQMTKLLGLAYASKLYRNNPELKGEKQFSNQGNEIVFGSIGDASTSEGPFFEAINAAGVIQVPLLMSVWDNGYGISVPRSLQTVNNSISKALSGFASSKKAEGITIYQVEAWNYPKLCEVYAEASEKVRKEHKPALVHVIDVTQPQGHSTSGSHERYKDKERLEWDKEFCCLSKMRQWILSEKIATEIQLNKIEEEEKLFVEKERKKAWDLIMNPIQEEKQQALTLLKEVQNQLKNNEIIVKCIESLDFLGTVYRRTIQSALFKAIFALKKEGLSNSNLLNFYQKYNLKYNEIYQSKLYSDTIFSPLLVKEVSPIFSENSELVDGRVVLLRCFENHFKNNPKFFALGEDVGKLGDVNLVFEGLNSKFGDLRVTDTGIRENTILGQGIGAAMRGLRPLVDIQYLDYFLYCLQPASDDLANLFYRTAGGQKAPVIIRTKGHRLEGMWHTGSPIAVILNAIRGMYFCVPRNMTQAAGMYNTLLQGDNPALVIEVLNGYRLKEKVPDNLSEFTVLLGKPEILREGYHVTLVTYGACCKIALEAADELAVHNIFIEVIDVQTLLPFDSYGVIKESIQKTNAVLFLDEDVQGGASAYMMQQVLEKQSAFDLLDVSPKTLCASDNRGAYGRDGDYYCKPQVEDVVCACFKIMYEREPLAKYDSSIDQ